MQQTNNLHSILLYAQQEAQRLGSTEIMPDHMILGILRLADGKAYELLMQAGMNPVDAIEKASGKYGRFDEAVKKIDPRKE